ncbi:nuclear transport factor 2 family protein [Falsihalocynthiibacter sp. S25ZX9]|uniref:nuclear transport factor 2 family protein n=1 Tax=Falsihalocynthiibacter sp. S25ZX9 TaxID=3240870 RepID=UPI003510A18D
MADKWLSWIGVWQGKKKLFEFMGIFGENFQTTAWDNTDAYASGDTVAVFSKINATTTKPGKETGPFTFALRAKVRDGKVVLWHGFEDSFAVSQAYHG